MECKTGILFLLFVNLTIISSTTPNFYSFKVKDIKGNDVDLSEYKGKVTLLVNTASECGFTDSHFKSLKRLHDILSFGDKFQVIVFPSNDFDQESWDSPEIEEYIRGHFKAEFPIMSKTIVSGDDASDVWKWVAETSVPPKWNFQKYLINRDGQIVENWPAATTVESIFKTIQSLVDGTEFVSSTTTTTPDPVQVTKDSISSSSDKKGENDFNKDEL